MNLLKRPTAQKTRISTMQIEAFHRALHLIVDIEPLLDHITASLTEILQARGVAVILLEPITNRYAVRKSRGYEAHRISELVFTPADRLIRWLSVNQCPLDVAGQGEVLSYLSPMEKEKLLAVDCALAVPLIVINRLIGLFLIRTGKDGFRYDKDTCRLVLQLAEQSALAIEYAAMAQFQEERLKRLFHTDKLATLGELAAGVAHEIRNPLTAIRSTVQYVRKDLDASHGALMDGVIEEVDRINQIIEGLLSFSRSSELVLDAVSIEDIIDQTLLILDSEFKTHHIMVDRRKSTGDLLIQADTDQLKQVLMNLLLNSMQAMPDGGHLTIETTVQSNAHIPAISTNQIVTLLIQDTGIGISNQDLPRIFNPFFTTRDTGTGLGLSISYGIISKHGGHIDADSQTTGDNTGTRMTIYLPVDDGG